MGHSGTIINGSGGVKLLADIRAVLGESSKKLSELCSSPEINWAAKYKPIRNAALKYLTDQDRAEAMCGLNITKYTSPAQLRSGYASEWTYLPPRGPAYGEPYRMRDFVKVSNVGVSSTTEGYNHAAVGPVYGWATQPHGTYTKGQGGATLGIQLNPENQRPAGSITWADVAPGGVSLAGAYFGFLLFKGTTYAGIKTMGTAIGSVPQIAELTFVDSDFDDDTTYAFVPVFSMTAYTTLSTVNAFPTGIFAVPTVSESSMHVAAASSAVQATVALDAYYAPGGFTVDIVATLYGRGAPGAVYYALYESQDGETRGTPALREGLLYNGASWPASGVTVNQSFTIRMSVPNYVIYDVVYNGVTIATESVEII